MGFRGEGMIGAGIRALIKGGVQCSHVPGGSPLLRFFSSLEILLTLMSGEGITGFGVMLGVNFWFNCSLSFPLK